MPQLDNYLVTLGVKGQNVVLATMDKIRKKGGELSKTKQTVKMTPAQGAATAEEKFTAATDKFSASVKASEKFSTETNRREEQTGKKFSKAADNLKSGAQNIANATSTLDPAAAMSSVTSALGTSLSGLSIFGFGLGRLPEGIANMANAALSMAKNSVDMAKQATAAYHQLATRNAAAAHYGEEIRGRDQLSNNERALFIDAVSGSMGKIQKPLADEINKLIGTKDTRSLARVGAGDWESTGTDKGWMLGQLSSSFQGLPPSIRQKLQASLLARHAGEIQDMTPGQKIAQQNAAKFANLEENQTGRLAARNPEGALAMSKTFNELQIKMFDGGLKLTGAVTSVASTFNMLIDTVPKVTAGLRNLITLLNNPSLSNARRVGSTFSDATPRADK